MALLSVRKPIIMNVDQAIETQFKALTPRFPELQGQVAVVTGGAKGIGQGIVLRLAREGMRIVIGDFDTESLSSTVASLERLGVSVLAIDADLSQSVAIRQLFEKTLETFGTVDLLVNNAANLDRKRLLDEHEELLDRQLTTNVRGPYLCSVQAAKTMREKAAATSSTFPQWVVCGPIGEVFPTTLPRALSTR